MTTQDKWMSAAVGGMAGFFAVASYLVLRALLSGVAEGDWLNFAGAIFGVVATIFATRLIDWLTKRAAAERKEADFRKSLRLFLKGLEQAHKDGAMPARLKAVQDANSFWQIVERHAANQEEMTFDQSTEYFLLARTVEKVLPNLRDVGTFEDAIANGAITKKTAYLLDVARPVAALWGVSTHDGLPSANRSSASIDGDSTS